VKISRRAVNDRRYSNHSETTSNCTHSVCLKHLAASGGGVQTSSPQHTIPIHDFDLRATHARTLLPAALAFVSFGFVLVRVRVQHMPFRISTFVTPPFTALPFLESHLGWGNLTGWLGTIISRAVRALAARLVQRQRIFVTTPWLCLLVLCLFGKYTLLCIY